MHALRLAVGIAWAVFWIGWLLSALTAKRGTRRFGGFGPRGIAVIAVIVLVRGFRGGSLEVHSLALGVVGAAVFAAGVALAIWARLILGRNWGMPMTQKLEPELITAGPYRLIRHPIYTGILLGLIGTALVTNLIGLGIALILGAYFIYSATVEERNLTATFPTAYPAYRARTKMLIPFVL